MNAYIQVITTLPSEDAAKAVARHLVERRLAACVQVSGPITSVYRWQGKTEEGQEWRCTAKSTATLFAEISRAITEIHPYEVPEIIATPLIDVTAAYAAWLDEQCG